ncbi:MAG: glycosyltransferase [Lachnospiraceae bacterium]|nr:glycosyltransferase [Lachnospiraceae bacterium]
MKVAIINTVIGTGSVGRIACGTADELIRHGYEVLLCRGRGEEVPGYANYRIGSDMDMYMHGVLSRITDRHGLFSKRATIGLIKKLEEYDPDIIQLHNIHGYYVNYRILFEWLKKSNRSIVWTLHDCWSFTGHCVHYEYRNCEKWKSGDCGDCPESKEYPASFICDASASNYKKKKESFTGVPNLHLVTPSIWLKSQVGISMLSEYPAEVINTGIDLEIFKPLDSDIRERYGIGNRILILSVANPWRERKGMFDMAKLALRLDAEKYAVAMIGLKRGQMNMLPPNIIKIGHTDSVSELASWYSTADIYVNLTYEDTFPTTNLEALACGTPVVTYRAGGSPETIDDGIKQIGLVTDKNDIGAVISAVEYFGKKDTAVSEACVRHSQRYDKKDKFRAYYELYQKI